MNTVQLSPGYALQASLNRDQSGISFAHSFHQNLSETEAANFLGISVSSLRKSRMNGARTNHLPPPPYVKLGRRVIYRSADLVKFLETNLTTAPAGVKQ